MKKFTYILQEELLIAHPEGIPTGSLRPLTIGLAIAVSAMFSGALQAQETASDLFLAPSAVPDQVWSGNSLITLGTTGSYVFTAAQAGGNDITDIQVLGELNPDPSSTDGSYSAADLNNISYANEATYFDENPTVDYSASTPGGTSDTVNFNQAGMYFVQVDTDLGSQQFQVSVDDYTLFDGTAQATGPQRIGGVIAPPNNGTTIVSTGPGDAAISNVMAQLPNAQTASSAQGVVNAISNAFVANGNMKVNITLIGHGKPGSILFGGQRINDLGDQNGGMTSAQFQAAIDQYCSGITFFSCSTAQGATGTNFLTSIASSIGQASGFTQPITATPTYFDVNAGAQFVTVVPEPGTLGLLGLGGCALIGWIRRRRG